MRTRYSYVRFIRLFKKGEKQYENENLYGYHNGSNIGDVITN